MQNEQLLHLDSFDPECMPVGGVPAGAGAMPSRWPAVMSVPATFDGQMTPVSSVGGENSGIRQDGVRQLTDGSTSRQDGIATQQQVGTTNTSREF